MHEFDRILNGEDVSHDVFVGVIHHRRERGRLSGASRTCYEHQSARLHSQFGEYFWRSQILEREYTRWNRTKDGCRAAILIEGVYAKAGEVGNLEREIDFKVLFENFSLRV